MSFQLKEVIILLVCLFSYLCWSVSVATSLWQCVLCYRQHAPPLPPPSPVDVRMQDNRILYCPYFKLLLCPSRQHFCDEDRSCLRNSTKFCARKAALCSFKWCGVPASCCSSQHSQSTWGVARKIHRLNTSSCDPFIVQNSIFYPHIVFMSFVSMAKQAAKFVPGQY